MKKCIVNCLLFIGLLVSHAYSQELVPPIQNFSPTDYSAASQNWDIALDERGVVYSANNQGLLIYDGLAWELFPLESQSIIRSVLPHDGRIYTGSYQEFGYWKTQANGCMEYNSLTHLMSELDMQSDEFWEIIAFNDAILFRSFGAVYEYKDDKITKMSDVVSTAFEVFQDRLVFAPRKNGLSFFTQDNNVKPLEGDLSLIDGINIRDLAVSGDTLLIGGKEALFGYSGEKLWRFRNEKLNQLLKSSELNHIISVSNKEIILGTIKNGVIQYDLENDTFQTFNRRSGLQNNTILGLAYMKGRLWLAQDKGLDVIDLEAPVKFYTDLTGELGAVYDLEVSKDQFYLASNTGVYKLTDGKLNLIENAEDHAWNLEKIDNDIYVNHNTGIYKIVNDQFIPVDTRTGSFSTKKIGENDPRLLVGHYTGVSLYDRKDGETRELNEITFPVKDLIFENEHTFWAAHPYEGIYKVQHDNFRGLEIDKVKPLGGRENFNPKIYNINNQVVSYANDEWYRYNPFKDDFEIFEEFRDLKNSRLIYKDAQYYVFVNSETGDFTITDLKNDSISLNPEQLNFRQVKMNENIIRENDSVFYVTLNDGFAKIDLHKLHNNMEDQWISVPYIKEVSDDLQSYPLSKMAEIPYKNARNISFKVGMPVSEAQELRYSLDGEEELTGTAESGQINFRNLKHGEYELQLSAIGNGVSRQLNNSYKFIVAPPWYLSVTMKMVYIMIILSLFFLAFWLNKQKLKKHQLQLEAKFEKEHAERLNRLEKERLMNEIDLKRKELANTTMMAAKKNEVLMEIQGELNKDKSKFSNQFRLKHIMNKINNAVKNKDEWQVFETNFNEVHEDFFKDLLKEYPKLTSKDLKLCSYLKMNLSSKEIAPLMGISVRGVEVHRYRLRKKMKLDGDVNLTKFLIKNF